MVTKNFLDNLNKKLKKNTKENTEKLSMYT